MSRAGPDAATHPPVRGTELRLTERVLDEGTGRAEFAYDLDGERFVETLELGPTSGPGTGPPQAALDLVLDACHILMGTSYFKLTAPRRLVLARPAPKNLVDVARLAYDEGMREFAVRNGLEVPLRTEIVAKEMGAALTAGTRFNAVPLPPGQGVLAPIGGGKDSAAVLTLLPRATGFCVSPTPAQSALAAAAGVELLEARRHLDPHLAQATTRPGSMNGHVPVTAINSSISVLAALLNGYGTVVMGNERSASEPTRVVGGVAVNHQFSKSLAMEAALQDVFAGAGIDYFSLLRQLSELSIAGIVARSALRSHFLSCNRAFRLSRPAASAQGWCLECAKCLFTFLCFAVHMAPDDAHAIFGGDPLGTAANVPGFRELWSDEDKPFDCVGERAESAVAMARLAQDVRWAGSTVVMALGAEAAEAAAAMGADMAELVRPGGPHLMPEQFAALASAAASEAAGKEAWS
ncbi:MAG TPA: hypothetical protein VFN61_04455 [Acidimicrobiales bacterium]|nr:hypothetical protein [Acidimicrobiales bacterium]